MVFMVQAQLCKVGGILLKPDHCVHHVGLRLCGPWHQLVQIVDRQRGWDVRGDRIHLQVRPRDSYPAAISQPESQADLDLGLLVPRQWWSICHDRNSPASHLEVSPWAETSWEILGSMHAASELARCSCPGRSSRKTSHEMCRSMPAPLPEDASAVRQTGQDQALSRLLTRWPSTVRTTSSILLHCVPA